MKCFTLLSL